MSGYKKIKVIMLFLAVMAFTGCSAVQKYIDRKGMESSCEDIIKGYKKTDPAVFNLFLKKFSVKKATEPFKPGKPEKRDIGEWELDFEGSENLIQEKLFFRTELSTLTYPDDKLAVYLYRKGEIKGKRVMIFVPGMGVSDFALKFIYRFFRGMIRNGYIVAVYIPPYHLERIPAGQESGEGLFTHDHIRNIRMITGCTSELRTIVKYFRDAGAEDISAWGGSMGASFLLLSGMYERYSSIAVMIPVLDWNSLLLDSPYLCKLKELLIQDGMHLDTVRRAYNMVSPIYTPLNIAPNRMMILSAEYDQLTSQKTVEAYRLKHNSPLTKVYNRSHSTILTDFDVYDDYNDQLGLWTNGVK